MDTKRIVELAAKQFGMTAKDAQQLIKLVGDLFRERADAAGFDERQIRRVTTKFRDAGRRSAPWRPASSRVPGRPQDGADGNRISRWLLPADHKFYADEVNATLTEVKYYLQALSMTGAPALPDDSLVEAFSWLLEHPVRSGLYLDPIQLVPIEFAAMVSDARSVQSGHLVPLDRGGRHIPSNTFLMLARSNQLQGNLTVDELLELMERIVNSHRARRDSGGAPGADER